MRYEAPVFISGRTRSEEESRMHGVDFVQLNDKFISIKFCDAH